MGPEVLVCSFCWWGNQNSEKVGDLSRATELWVTMSGGRSRGYLATKLLLSFQGSERAKCVCRSPGCFAMYSSLYFGLGMRKRMYETPSVSPPGTTTTNRTQKTAAGIPKSIQAETSVPQAFPLTNRIPASEQVSCYSHTLTLFCTKLQVLSSVNYYIYKFLFSSAMMFLLHIRWWPTES